MSFYEFLKSSSDLLHLAAATLEEVQQAELALGVSFSDEYKEYLLSLGVAAVGAHEFTGICGSSRLNVVDVTLKERELCGHDCDEMYVVEQEGIDNIVVWQASDRKVYWTVPGNMPVFVAASLAEYLLSEPLL